jgi:sodium transport system permease protein
MSGAMSIGLDAVAGEKERNTLGTLLVNKVSRTSIVVGKIISVMVVSFVSALFTIGGLGIILAAGILFGAGGTGSAFAVFTPWVVIGLFLILIPLSTVLVSIIILVGTFARNLKEASSYMTPVFFIVIFLGIMTMSINFEISKKVYLIPIASSVFAMKDLLLGKLTVSLLLLNIIVTVLAASILIYLCVRMFKSEKILFRV